MEILQLLQNNFDPKNNTSTIGSRKLSYSKEFLKSLRSSKLTKLHNELDKRFLVDGEWDPIQWFETQVINEEHRLDQETKKEMEYNLKRIIMNHEKSSPEKIQTQMESLLADDPAIIVEHDAIIETLSSKNKPVKQDEDEYNLEKKLMNVINCAKESSDSDPYIKKEVMSLHELEASIEGNKTSSRRVSSRRKNDNFSDSNAFYELVDKIRRDSLIKEKRSSRQKYTRRNNSPMDELPDEPHRLENINQLPKTEEVPKWYKAVQNAVNACSYGTNTSDDIKSHSLHSIADTMNAVRQFGNSLAQVNANNSIRPEKNLNDTTNSAMPNDSSNVNQSISNAQILKSVLAHFKKATELSKGKETQQRLAQLFTQKSNVTGAPKISLVDQSINGEAMVKQ